MPKFPSVPKTSFLPIILIIALGFAVYGNAFPNNFIWDDKRLIEHNEFLKDWTQAPVFFSKGTGAGLIEECNSYRPLQMITYMIDYALWKFDVRGYHLTNILFHILVALAISWLINILFQNRFLSLVTGILFVVHPIHTEAVTYISGRADPLAFLFLLLCFIFYIRSACSKGIADYILMLLSYTLALLSRENSLVLPALLLLYHYSFKKSFKPYLFGSVCVLAGIYVLLRVTVLKDILANFVMPSTTVLQRIPGFFVAIANYIRLLVLPLDQHMEYSGSHLFRWGDPQAVTGVIILGVSLFYAFRKRKAGGLGFFCIGWFFLGLLPVSNLYPLNAFMSEHWLYLPSLGFFLLLARGLEHVYAKRNFRAFAALSTLALIIFYSCLTVRQNLYWRDPEIFYKKTLQYAPDFPRLHYNLGNFYYHAGRMEEAVASYEEALKVDPSFSAAYSNLGAAYYALNQRQKAIEAYTKALAFDPDPSDAYSNLGILYEEAGKIEEAIALHQKALVLDPGSGFAYNNLAAVYFHQQQYDLAIQYFDKAVELGYSNPLFSKMLKPYRGRQK